MNASKLLLLAALLAAAGLVVPGCDEEPASSAKEQAAAPHKTGPDPAPVVNVLCPIMGSKIDPNAVPESLVREHKGQKVGFCCGGCPAAWDKLSGPDKDAKLAEAMPK